MTTPTPQPKRRKADLVERAAEAAYDVHHAGRWVPKFKDCPEDLQRHWVWVAQAAINAFKSTQAHK